MNFNVGDILQAQYDIPIIVASYVVSVLGSFAALYHAQHMFRRDGSLYFSSAFGGAVALGGIGIWTMHFIGMIGYRLPMRVVYDGVLTVLSLVAAIVIAGIALVLAGGRGKFSVTGWLFGSLLAAAGVCVMHYMGMYAMNLRADMVLDMKIVGVSVAIAFTAAAAALWLAFHITRNSHRLAASLVMGLAVCAMHYTGMSAAQFICVQSKAAPAWAIGGNNLPVLVFAVAGGVLVLLCWNILGLISRAQQEDQKGSRHPPVAPIMRAATPARR
jgi:NO-binding membrane sensor protein with MHYT domain